MHVCFAAIDYHESGSGGGIASYVSAVGQELVARGHEVTVLASGPERGVIKDGGVRVMRAPAGNLHWYLHKLHAPSLAVLPVRELEWSRALRRELDRLIQESPVDVIESTHHGGQFLRLGPDGPPVIARLHGDQYTFAKHAGDRITLGIRLTHRLQQAAWARAAAVTAPSRHYADEIAVDAGWSDDRISVIPNPVSPVMVEEARDSADDDGRAGSVLFVGRLQRVKGILPLLQSVPSVMRHAPDTRYIIAGARHVSVDDDALGAAMAGGDASSHVRIVGHVPWRQLPALYREASIYVMPSYYETFGLSVVEAMAFGLPVIASRAGALPELVEDGVTGLLVPPGDAEALADATVKLLADSRLRRRLGRAGRERALAEYNVSRVTGMTVEIYERALAARRLGTPTAGSTRVIP